jgi:hypothetical protein
MSDDTACITKVLRLCFDNGYTLDVKSENLQKDWEDAVRNTVTKHFVFLNREGKFPACVNFQRVVAFSIEEIL